jgi:CheY-like chemotaxis protein
MPAMPAMPHLLYVYCTVKSTKREMLFGGYSEFDDARSRTNSTLPVFSVNAYAMKEDRQKVLDAEFNAYLPQAHRPGGAH